MKKFRLKSLRKSRKITQQKLAVNLNVEQSTISEYERQVRIPDIYLMEKICDYFDVSMDYLIGRSEIKNIISLELSADEINFVHMYRKLSKIFREKLKSYMDGLSDLEN